MGAFARIREYLKGHGAGYTLRRLWQVFRQRYLGTYDRRRKKEAATDADGLDIKGKISADLTQLDTTTPGEYPVTLTLEDYAGNKTSVEITVSVVAD